MEVTQALKELADLTASQWGMVTTAQANTLGISRLQLSRLAEGGHLERVSHGIYRDPGAPPERYDTLKAAWLSIDPRRTAQDRLSDRPSDAVVSGAAASHLLGIGDLVPEPYEFTVPRRRQTQRTELTYRVRELPPEALTMREGLPVTTQEQTIADLVESRIDLSLVADVLSETEALDSKRLAALLSPLAQRNGFERGDGEALLDELERLAHRDVASLARAVSGTALAGEISKQFLHALDPVAQAAVMAEIARTNDALKESVATSSAVHAMQNVLHELVEATSRLSFPQETTNLFITAMKKLQGTLIEPPAPPATLDDRTRRQIISMAEQMKHLQQLSDKPATAQHPER